MPRGLTASIASVARGQHGLVTRPQLLAIGLSERAIDYQIAEGLLLREHASVYRMAGVPESWDQQLFAALLAAGQGSAISHLAAALYWRLEGLTTARPHILLPHSRRVYLEGVIIHRTRVLKGRDVTRRRGIRVTSPARTIMDVAGLVPSLDLEIALDDGLRRQIMTLDQVRASLDDRGPNGVRGWGRLDRLVNERVGTKPTGSSNETRFFRGLIDRGIPAPVKQFALKDADGRLVAQVDFAYPELRLAIEVDGSGHASYKQWKADLARQNRMTLSEWRFLRFPRTDRKGQRETLETIERAFRLFGEPNRR